VVKQGVTPLCKSLPLFPLPLIFLTSVQEQREGPIRRRVLAMGGVPKGTFFLSSIFLVSENRGFRADPRASVRTANSGVGDHKVNLRLCFPPPQTPSRPPLWVGIFPELGKVHARAEPGRGLVNAA